MAHSVYISSNLTQQQLEFMKLLDDYEIELFQFEEIESQIDKKFDNLNEVLENLVHKEQLSRIFIQTTQRKTDKALLGTTYKFVTINPGKRTGILYNGYGNTKYPITDIEKTIIDCFDQPQYSGGYAELIRALFQAEIDTDKMVTYCKSVGNAAATKRIGFLLELFKKPSMDKFIDFAKEQVNEKYNLFDPQGTEKGEFIAGWKLRLNISKDELLNLSYKQY
jgi:predicted transcriptional regulator of viral defense system